MNDTAPSTNEENTNLSPEPDSTQEPGVSELEFQRARITELENTVGQLKDQLLRKAAEFENYKRRVENDYSSVVRFSNEELITRLLPVVDDFERSMKSVRGISGDELSQNEQSLMRGVELVFTKLKKYLESQGVKHFDVAGKPFDPAFHDALMQVVREDVPPHTVIEEVEKGYMLHDKVIRHARVVVSADHGDAGPASAGGTA